MATLKSLLPSSKANNSRQYPSIQIELSPSPEHLHRLLRNASFVVAPPEHLSIGCESRLLWSALHAGAIPIIAGPADKLGLASLGSEHPLLQVPPDNWRDGLVNLLSPIVKLM